MLTPIDGVGPTLVLQQVKTIVIDLWGAIMNNLTASAAARSAALNAITALLNAGGAGNISIYTGSQPANPDAAVSSQILLVTLALNATAFAAAVNGVATANAISSGIAVATGVAAWARLTSGAGVAVLDCAVGSSGSDINLPTVTINEEDTVSISAYTLTHP